MSGFLNPIYMKNLAPTPQNKKVGGAMRDRTADLLRAKQALSQLSYSPPSLYMQVLATRFR